MLGLCTQKLGDPVIERHREFEERPEAMDALAKSIVHFEKIVEQYKKKVSCEPYFFSFFSLDCLFSRFKCTSIYQNRMSYMIILKGRRWARFQGK